MILVHSAKGVELRTSVSERLEINLVTLEEAGRQNQAMVETATLTPKRTEALNLIRHGKIFECSDLLPYPRPGKGIWGFVGRGLRKFGVRKLLSKKGE